MHFFLVFSFPQDQRFILERGLLLLLQGTLFPFYLGSYLEERPVRSISKRVLGRSCILLFLDRRWLSWCRGISCDREQQLISIWLWKLLSTDNSHFSQQVTVTNAHHPRTVLKRGYFTSENKTDLIISLILY